MSFLYIRKHLSQCYKSHLLILIDDNFSLTHCPWWPSWSLSASQTFNFTCRFVPSMSDSPKMASYLFKQGSPCQKFPASLPTTGHHTISFGQEEGRGLQEGWGHVICPEFSPQQRENCVWWGVWEGGIWKKLHMEGWGWEGGRYFLSTCERKMFLTNLDLTFWVITILTSCEFFSNICHFLRMKRKP